MTRSQRFLAAHPYLPLIALVVSIVSAVGTIYSAIQASRSAEAAKQSAKAAEQATRVGQRAYLGISALDYSAVVDGYPRRVVVQVKNAGRTPASDVVVRFKLTYRAELVRTPDYGPLMTVGGVSTITPEVSKPLILEMSAEESAIAAKIRADGAEPILHLFGLILYKDVFGEEHRTRYCSWYVPARKSFSDCPANNEMS